MKLITKTVIVFIAVLTLYSCETLSQILGDNKPTAKLEKARITGLTFEDIQVTFDISIHNPYPVEIKLAGLDLDFQVEGKPFFKTSTPEGLSLKAKSKSMQKMAVDLKYQALETAVKDYIKKDKVNTTINGIIKVKLLKEKVAGLPSTWDIPFTLQKAFPTFKPEVRVKNFRVNKPDTAAVKESLQKAGKDMVDPAKLSGMFTSIFSGKKPVSVLPIKPEDIDLAFQVAFDIELKNKAKGRIDFSDMAYGFSVNKVKLLDGKTADIIRKDGLTVIKIVNEFKSSSLKPEVLKAFKEGRADYSIDGSSTVKLDTALLDKPVTMKFTRGGRFDINTRK